MFQEAQVVCQQLGYDDGLLTTFHGKSNLEEKNVDTVSLATASNSNRVLPAQIR